MEKKVPSVADLKTARRKPREEAVRELLHLRSLIPHGERGRMTAIRMAVQCAGNNLVLLQEIYQAVPTRSRIARRVDEKIRQVESGIQARYLLA